MENFYRLGEGFYLVRTQAGFKQALKEYGNELIGFNARYSNYPKIYPSIIQLFEEYYGFEYIQCKTWSVSEWRNFTSSIEQVIRQSDFEVSQNNKDLV